MTDIPIALRLEAMSILDRMLDNTTDWFLASDARRLISIIPHTRDSWFGIAAHWDRTEKGAEGHAAGIGNIQLEDERQRGSVELGIRAKARVGGYQITHVRGSMEINLMWGDLDPDDDSPRARLRYNKLTSHPIKLEMSAYRNLDVPLTPIRITFLGWRKWKQPQLTVCPPDHALPAGVSTDLELQPKKPPAGR